jgi:hypothetical protein
MKSTPPRLVGADLTMKYSLFFAENQPVREPFADLPVECYIVDNLIRDCGGINGRITVAVCETG